jgi:hypothetical protein
MPKFMKWVALAMFIFFMFVWGFGGWNAPKYVVAATEGRTLFYVGLIVVAAYAPLYYWRIWRDKVSGAAGGAGPVIDVRETAQPAVATAAADSTTADLGAP